MSATRPGIELDDISMSFGTNQVLRGVSLHLEPGRVTALIGANGAGKSTLIKILSGVHQGYTGELRIDGEAAILRRAGDAHAAGIQTVHQRIDEGIVPGLSVAENLLFDRITSGELPTVASLRRLLPAAREVMATLGLEWPTSLLRTDVFEIGIAEQQLLLLARTLSRHPRLLILDEPTSALSSSEVDRLFEVIRRLCADGVGVLYVSHHLREIDSLADRLYVLRDGAIRDEQTPPFHWGTAERSMLGTEAAAVEGDGSRPRDQQLRGTEPIVELTGVRLLPRSEPLSLDVRRGEVTGVFGLLGAGKTELAGGISGAAPFRSGSMTLRGVRFAPRHPAEAIERGVYLVPEDRAAQAMLPGWSITRTATLPFLPRFAARGFMKPRAELAHAGSLIRRFGVVAERPQQTVDSLSGGNQQKVVVGRWMEAGVSVLLLDEPFRGVDIGARHELSLRVRELATDGAAVMLFASDVDEILAVCDRILVLAEGVVIADRSLSETSRDELLADVSSVHHDSEITQQGLSR